MELTGRARDPEQKPYSISELATDEPRPLIVVRMCALNRVVHACKTRLEYASLEFNRD